MDKLTCGQVEEALRKSIERKWAQLVEDPVAWEPPCELCRLDPDGDCDACPIMVYTGKDNCDGTPYYVWRNLRRRYYAGIATYNEVKSAAAKEKKFLQEVYDHFFGPNGITRIEHGSR